MTGGESKVEQSRGNEKPGVFLIQNNETLQILFFAFIRKEHGGNIADGDPCFQQSINPALLRGMATAAAQAEGHNIKQSVIFPMTSFSYISVRQLLRCDQFRDVNYFRTCLILQSINVKINESTWD